MPQVRRNKAWCLLVQKVNGFMCMMRWVHLYKVVQQHNLCDVAFFDSQCIYIYIYISVRRVNFIKILSPQTKVIQSAIL